MNTFLCTNIYIQRLSEKYREFQKRLKDGEGNYCIVLGLLTLFSYIFTAVFLSWTSQWF